MPHQEFVSLTKEQRRNLPHPNDSFIDIEGHSKLTIRYGQAKFQIKDHALTDNGCVSLSTDPKAGTTRRITKGYTSGPPIPNGNFNGKKNFQV